MNDNYEVTTEFIIPSHYYKKITTYSNMLYDSYMIRFTNELSVNYVDT